ncbi:hypothetical protein ACHWQZ_G012678 [Mnemiopsis leidyi]
MFHVTAIVFTILVLWATSSRNWFAVERKQLVNHILDLSPIEVQTGSLSNNSVNVIELDLYSTRERLLVPIEISVLPVRTNYTITVRFNRDNVNVTEVGQTGLSADSRVSCTLSKVGTQFVIGGGRRVHRFTVGREEVSCFRLKI